MESLNPFLQTKTIYNTLTVSYKKLANFIFETPEFILQNSILDVAAACDVAEATVSRFCRLLGYKGYHDFKIAVAKSLSENGTNDLLHEPISLDAPVQTTAQHLLAIHTQALNETNLLISEENLKKAVELLVSAKRIMFLGMGSSLISAMEVYNKFLRVTPNVSINLESHMQMRAASLLSKEDVAVIISHSGSTREIVDMAKKAKEHDAKVICVTRYKKSPLTKHSDVTLLYSSDEQLVYDQSISGLPGRNYLLTLLYLEFFKNSQEKFRKNQDESSSLLMDKLY